MEPEIRIISYDGTSCKATHLEYSIQRESVPIYAVGSIEPYCFSRKKPCISGRVTISNEEVQDIFLSNIRYIIILFEDKKCSVTLEDIEVIYSCRKNDTFETVIQFTSKKMSEEEPVVELDWSNWKLAKLFLESEY